MAPSTMTMDTKKNPQDSNEEEEEEEEKEVHKDVDYILQEIVGGHGWWQWTTIAKLLPLIFTGGYPLLLTMFSVNAPRHRCFVEQCDDEHSKINESWVQYALPTEHASQNFLTEAETFDPCKVYSSVSDTCSASSFNRSSSVSCDKFIYDRSQFEETLATQINLVCEDDYKRRLLTTVMMCGLMAGSLIGGRLSDRFGRKKTMLISILLNAPSIIISGFTPNYYAYAIFRFITCTALPIMWVSGQAFAIEIFSPKYRRHITCVRDIPFSMYIFTVIIYFNRHWTYMHLTVGLLSCILCPMWFFIPESPRWLASNNRKDEAEAIFLDIARGNKKKVSQEQRKELREILNTIDAEREDHLSPLDMFRSEHAVKTMILLLCWNTTVVSFYALTLNTTKLDGDAVMNMFYSVLCDTPVCLLIFFVLDKWGRRWTTFIAQMVLGTSILTLAFIPKSMPTLVLTFYLIGKTGGAVSFIMVYLITAELYPTNLRSTAIGMCSMISRIGGMGANFVPVLAMYWQPLPMVVLGIPTIIAAVLALFLSETSGKDLPQTMREAQELDEEAHLHLPHLHHDHNHHHRERQRSHVKYGSVGSGINKEVEMQKL